MNILIRGFVSPDTNTCTCDCNCNCNTVCTLDSGFDGLSCARAGKYNWCSCDSPGGYMQY